MDTYILTYKGNTVLWVCVHLCITCQERVKNGVHSGYGMRWIQGILGLGRGRILAGVGSEHPPSNRGLIVLAGVS